MRKIFSVIFCLLSLSLSAQSKIKQAKNNLGTPQQTQLGSSSQSSGYSTSFGDSSVSFWDIFFESFLYDLTLALAYNIAFETEVESEGRMSRATLNRYPFYGNSKGDYQYEAPWEDFVLWRLEGSNYYFSEKGRFFTNDFNAKVRIGERFGINLQYLHFWEKLLQAEDEKLDIFVLTGEYYRIRTQRVSTHWGIGAGYVGNELKQWGLAFELGNEIFFRPFSLHADLKYVYFKRNDVFSFSVGPRFYYRNLHIGAKYQRMNLASVQTSGFSVGLGIVF